MLLFNKIKLIFIAFFFHLHLFQKFKSGILQNFFSTFCYFLHLKQIHFMKWFIFFCMSTNKLSAGVFRIKAIAVGLIVFFPQWEFKCQLNLSSVAFSKEFHGRLEATSNSRGKGVFL